MKSRLKKPDGHSLLPVKEFLSWLLYKKDKSTWTRKGLPESRGKRGARGTPLGQYFVVEFIHPGTITSGLAG